MVDRGIRGGSPVGSRSLKRAWSASRLARSQRAIPTWDPSSTSQPQAIRVSRSRSGMPWDAPDGFRGSGPAMIHGSPGGTCMGGAAPIQSGQWTQGPSRSGMIRKCSEFSINLWISQSALSSRRNPDAERDLSNWERGMLRVRDPLRTVFTCSIKGSNHTSVRFGTRTPFGERISTMP